VRLLTFVVRIHPPYTSSLFLSRAPLLRIRPSFFRPRRCSRSPSFSPMAPIRVLDPFLRPRSTATWL
jgi:hypothetical protein